MRPYGALLDIDTILSLIIFYSILSRWSLCKHVKHVCHPQLQCSVVHAPVVVALLCKLTIPCLCLVAFAVLSRLPTCTTHVLKSSISTCNQQLASVPFYSLCRPQVKRINTVQGITLRITGCSKLC